MPSREFSCASPSLAGRSRRAAESRARGMRRKFPPHFPAKAGAANTGLKPRQAMRRNFPSHFLRSDPVAASYSSPFSTVPSAVPVARASLPASSLLWNRSMAGRGLPRRKLYWRRSKISCMAVRRRAEAGGLWLAATAGGPPSASGNATNIPNRTCAARISE